MDKIRIVIVEDEFIVAEDIASLMTEHEYEVTQMFSSAEEALPYVLKNPPDILLVDIQLSGAMTGIQLVDKVKQSMSFPVIYITASSDEHTYKKAKPTRPNAFLVKPFTPGNLLTSIDLALYNYSRDKIALANTPKQQDEELHTLIHRTLFVKSNGKHKKMSPDDILFVEAAGSYIHIQTSCDRFTLAQNLSKFLRKTPLDNLQRIHRSYLVNIDKVDSFEESCVYIADHKIPISETFKDEFFSRIHRL